MEHLSEIEITKYVWDEIEDDEMNEFNEHLLECEKCSKLARREFESMFKAESWSAKLHGELYHDNCEVKLLYPEMIDIDENTDDYIIATKLKHKLDSLMKDLHTTKDKLQAMLNKNEISIYKNCIVLHKNLIKRISSLVPLHGEAAGAGYSVVKLNGESAGTANCIIYNDENNKSFVELELSGDSITLRNRNIRKIRLFLNHRKREQTFFCIDLQRGESQKLDNLFGDNVLVTDFTIKLAI